MIILGAPTYTRYDLVAKMVESAATGTRTPDRIVIVDNGSRWDEKYRGPSAGVDVIRPGRNLGCAGGWNEICRQATCSDDIIIISNDDIVLSHDGVATMARAIEQTPDDVVVHGHAWSLFAMRARVWRRVGAFDERFWPAYFEDNDYQRRLEVAGVRRVVAHSSKSHAGSATIRSYNQQQMAAHHAQFRANRAYFIEKWGAAPGAVRATWPKVVARGEAKTLEERYVTAATGSTDICEHLPVLRDLASRVEHVTEFGVRSGESTVAFLAAQPRVLRSFDLEDTGIGGALTAVAGRTDFVFMAGDTREIDIAPTDLLFIDTLHTYDQLRAEFARHADKARRWIVLHDTTTFGDRGELPGSVGLWPAVEELLAEGRWKLKERRTNNNGLTVLERSP